MYIKIYKKSNCIKKIIYIEIVYNKYARKKII